MELISTWGNRPLSDRTRAEDIPVSSVTGFPEIMDGSFPVEHCADLVEHPPERLNGDRAGEATWWHSSPTEAPFIRLVGDVWLSNTTSGRWLGAT